MTRFNTRAFGSLLLCCMAALSGTLSNREPPAHFSPWLPFQAHSACSWRASLAHMHRAQVPSSLLSVSYFIPKGKVCQILPTVIVKLDFIQVSPPLTSVRILLLLPRCSQGLSRWESCHQRPILGSYSEHSSIYNSITTILLFETLVNE